MDKFTLEQLHHKRGSFKSQLTQFEKFIEEAEVEPLDETLISNLRKRLVAIENKYAMFDSIQDQIELLTEGSVDEEAHRKECETRYFAICAYVDAKINSKQLPSPNNHIEHKIQSQSVQLPTIELPIFDGDLTKWRSFQDAFNALINENRALSDVEKLCYLRSALRGDALNAIQAFETTSENYNVAYTLLKERFSNTRKIVFSHTLTLLNLKCNTIKQFINCIEQQTRSLKTLGIEVDKWDAILITLLLSKLDTRLISDWENHINSKYSKNIIPTYSDFLKFLTLKSDSLDSIKYASKPQSHNSSHKVLHTNVLLTRTSNENNTSCVLCKRSHHIYACKEFLEKDVSTRLQTVKALRLCINCLRPGHFQNMCRSSKCRTCNHSHNTLLHRVLDINTNKNISNDSNSTNNSNRPATTAHCTTISLFTQRLLPTAIINVQNSRGEVITARALLDSASQSNFVSESLVRKLGLQVHNININISGITRSSSEAQHYTNLRLFSRFSNHSYDAACLVLKTITENIPQISFQVNAVNFPQNVVLADETFNKSSEIDILLGVQLFWDIIEGGKSLRLTDQLKLKSSTLGWLVAGHISDTQSTVQSYVSLNSQVEKFWKLDDFCKDAVHLTPEEKICEDLFEKTISRDNSGRFIVTIPLKENHESLGDSKFGATKRFLAMENRLQRDPELKKMYTAFIHEYADLGHMTKCGNTEIHDTGYFLPHHHVLRESSTTTKLRVVFDGSYKTTSGYSLNDIQYTGPTIQSDLFSILIRFRQYDYIVTADIQKMYRQIWVNKSQRHLQQILWRDHPANNIEAYHLNTVTYGTASAPYLAIKCLHQLAKECEKDYPVESKIITRDFYVDDLLTGSNDAFELLNICRNISDILSSAGFTLHKWSSNMPTNDSSNVQFDNSKFDFVKNDIKTLGIYFHPTSDLFQYSFSEKAVSDKITKRSILSETAQIFDPMGLLSPVTVIPKILIQELWNLKLDWDQDVPMIIKNKWQKFVENLSSVKNIAISRKIANSKADIFEIHGFSDASERAYGACVYLKSIAHNNSEMHLIAAKSRVAPVKNVTLPRLELCAAVLLSELCTKIKSILNIPISKITYWSDSQVTLAWINGNPSQWKTFVANRVAEIQRLTDKHSWKYVNTKDNPADYVSRGVQPNDLGNLQIWWHGPQWLNKSYCDKFDEYTNITINDIPEQKQMQVSLPTTLKCSIFDKYSSLNTMVKVYAYCRRFINNCKGGSKLTGNLSFIERKLALNNLIKLAQNEVYSSEIKLLSQNKPIPSNSNIISLTPFLDSNGLLRVGGRLSNSNFNYNLKHQLILPPKHPLTISIIVQTHINHLHCGVQGLLNALRQLYWPIGAKSLIKGIIHKCITCYKTKPITEKQIMGNLPITRLSPSPPFYFCGVDYAGPFLTRDRRARGYKTFKAYVCLFVCFNTRAVHLELVSDMTTEAFMAALRRFIARRGLPHTIHSDNGSNFIGANSELHELRKLVKLGSDQMLSNLANEGKPLNWKYIPARSPHMGGIWESNIKIIKSHLTKTIGQAILTFEEFYTLLTQIEAIVNSRPISPLSDDPHDLNPLTPSHFLIGRPLTAAPDDNYTTTPENRLSAFQRMQKIVQDFWKRWKIEYIHTLQPRKKWQRENQDPLQENDMVLLVDENTPPMKWRLGRIIQLWPGPDGHTRVVTIRTSTGTTKRSITKLCRLPIK